MKARFDFYEQVRIAMTGSSNSDLNGRCGVVVGRTETEDGHSWYYAVELDREAESWCFFENELEATGQRFTRDDFYDDSSIRVKVDKNGLGSIDPPKLDN